jgi:hypothetical protein
MFHATAVLMGPVFGVRINECGFKLFLDVGVAGKVADGF